MAGKQQTIQAYIYFSPMNNDDQEDDEDLAIGSCAEKRVEHAETSTKLGGQAWIQNGLAINEKVLF